MKSSFHILILPLLACLLLAGCTEKPQVYNPQSYDELKGHVVCYLEGSIQQDYALNKLKDRGITFVSYGNATDCMLALNEGKADVFFGASLYAYNDAFHRQHLKVGKLLDDIDAPYAFGVKKGNVRLTADINAFQDSLAQCGKMQEIIDRWFDTNNTDFHNCVKVEPTNGKVRSGQPALRLGISGVKPPTSILIDNKWTGCEVEIMQIYAASRGLQLQIDTYDFGNLIPALQSGKIDVVASTLAINEERKAKIDFTDSHAAVKAGFIIPDPDYEVNSTFWDDLKNSAYYSFVVENRWKLLVDGFWVTLLISVSSLILGSLLGGGICWMTMNRRRSLRMAGKTYLYLVRNIPMLVLLMILFYVVFAHAGLPATVVAIIAFGMNSSAYISEIYRSGIQSVDSGQTEAGLAMGFSPVRTFFYFVAPQAIQKALPVFKNEAVSLLKGTSVVGYISVIDLTKASDLIRSASFEALLPLLVISAVYFLLAWLFTTVIDILAKRL